MTTGIVRVAFFAAFAAGVLIDDHIDTQPQQLLDETLKAVVASRRVSKLDRDVASLDVA